MHIPAEFAQIAPYAVAWLTAHAQSFASSAGATIITAIWQGAVIVSVLEIATRLMPRISAAHRFALWSAGFVLSFALPILPFIHFGSEQVPALASSSAAAAVSPHPLLQIDARWGFAIAALWLVVSLLRAAVLIAQSIRLRRLWKTAHPVQASASLTAVISSLRGGRIAICTTQLLDRPSVIGFFSPRILIPDWLYARLSPGELDQIVLHESEHLRRADDWTNLLQKLCLVLFPLSPALAWIEHRLCREREMACDEGVVRITNAPRAYAACLASLAERRLERRAEALSLGAWHRRSELVHRVHRILLRKTAMSKTAAGVLLATLGSLLLAGSFEMSRLPQLVVFVPTHNTQAIAPARQIQVDALLARESATPALSLPAGYSALPAKAIVNDQRSLASIPARKHTAKTARSARPFGSPAPDTTQQVAKSDQLGDRVISSTPQIQQWVVVTEWREVHSANRIPQSISDFEPESDLAQSQAQTNKDQLIAGTASANKATTSPGASNQLVPQAHGFAVTQLILRVVPAGQKSTSAQPPTTMVRDGWFVIQL